MKNITNLNKINQAKPNNTSFFGVLIFSLVAVFVISSVLLVRLVMNHDYTFESIDNVPVF